MDRFMSLSLLFPGFFVLLLSCYKRELLHLIHHHLNMGIFIKLYFVNTNPQLSPCGTNASQAKGYLC